MHDFSEKFRIFSTIFGESVAQDSLNYTRERDELDSRHLKPQSGVPTVPGNLKGASIQDHSVVIDFDNISLHVSLPFDNCFRITWQKCSVDTLIRSEFNWIELQLGQNVIIRKNSVELSCSESTLTVFSNGEILLEKHDRTFLRRDLEPEISESKVILKSRVREKSSMYGFGEKAVGLDLRGRNVSLWNHDPDGTYGPGDDPLYIGIPVYMDLESGKGYLAFYNTPTKCEVDICSANKDEISFTFNGGGLDYFLLTGEVQDLSTGFSEISGKPMMPPEWGLGFHQSRYSYMSSKEISEVASGFEENDLPVSAIHMDIDHMDGYRVFTFDKERFGDVENLSRELMGKGIRIVTIIDPGIKKDQNYEVYRKGERGGYFVRTPEGNTVYAPVWAGMSAFPDFTNEEAQKWWAANYEFYLQKGVSGFWHDMNEPATFTLWGDNTIPLSASFEKGPHSTVHNLFGLYMAKAAHDGLKGRKNGGRPFILTRSGWAGIQKYAFVWTGDTESSEREMLSTVSTIINMGLSGIPYVGVDIGGFSGSPSRELYLRWFQLGSFFPFFRVHSAKNTEMREPWRFGEGFMTIARKFLKLRYRLMPYYYSLAHESHVKGYPMIRPAFWIDSGYVYGDREEQIFMVGDQFLVIPVTPGSPAVSVPLPDGNWYSIWDDSVHSGRYESVVPSDVIPVLARDGSIVPMKEEDDIVIHLYAGKEGNGTLYLDDGKVDPAFCLYEFSLKKNGNRYTVSYQAKEHDYPALKDIRFAIHGEIEGKFEGASILGVIDKHALICEGASGEFIFS